jgi:hypothetical protein
MMWERAERCLQSASCTLPWLSLARLAQAPKPSLREIVAAAGSLSPPGGVLYDSGSIILILRVQGSLVICCSVKAAVLNFPQKCILPRHSSRRVKGLKGQQKPSRFSTAGGVHFTPRSNLSMRLESPRSSLLVIIAPAIRLITQYCS